MWTGTISCTKNVTKNDDPVPIPRGPSARAADCLLFRIKVPWVVTVDPSGKFSFNFEYP